MTDDIDWPPVNFNGPCRGVGRDKVDLPDRAGAYGNGDDPPHGPVNLEAVAAPFLQQPVYCEPARPCRWRDRPVGRGRDSDPVTGPNLEANQDTDGLICAARVVIGAAIRASRSTVGCAVEAVWCGPTVERMRATATGCYGPAVCGR